jgi:hypothetical protein
MSQPQPIDVERLLRDEQARSAPKKRSPALAALARDFRTLGEDRYRLDVPEVAVSIEIDRLRRERHELIGELSVSCGMPGALTVDGANLSIADFNVSSSRARLDRAKFLAVRSSGQKFDWTGLIEEFCQRVLRAERTGEPGIDLRSAPRPSGADVMLLVAALALPRRHPAILFGDGGTAKSYMSLYFAGLLARQGIRVGYFDWELSPDEHRDRLERLFPDFMPKVIYARCERPLVHEVDRLRRIVREGEIEYSVFDSVVFACDGPPETADSAARYFRAVRQIGGGSLHIGHVSKAEGADKYPFGSVFWHNAARGTWFVKTSGDSQEEGVLRVGLFNRKANLGRLQPPAGFAITFTDDATTFRRADVADSPDLAVQLSVRERMMALGGAIRRTLRSTVMSSRPDIIRKSVSPAISYTVCSSRTRGPI